MDDVIEKMARAGYEHYDVWNNIAEHEKRIARQVMRRAAYTLRPGDEIGEMVLADRHKLAATLKLGGVCAGDAGLGPAYCGCDGVCEYAAKEGSDA